MKLPCDDTTAERFHLQILFTREEVDLLCPQLIILIHFFVQQAIQLGLQTLQLDPTPENGLWVTRISQDEEREENR